MNENARKNLKNLIELMCDGQQEVSMSAALVNKHLVSMGENPKQAGLFGRLAGARLDDTIEMIEAQALRCLRVADELREIRKNLQIS